MRASHLVLVPLLWLAASGPSTAQSALPAPLVRFDVQGAVGWVNASHPDLATYDDWDHGIARGAVGAGWYWTDHLKTEVEFQIDSTAEYYGFEQIQSDGRISYRSSREELRARGLGIGQVYQFGRNAWVHPFIGGGVDLRWESIERELQPLVVWDANAGVPRETEPGRRVGPTTSFKARPFASFGLKAYLSRRVFFRSDFRVGVHDGVDEVVARAGFGIDF